MKKTAILVTSFILLLAACKKKDNQPVKDTGKLSVIFDNTANGKSIVLGSEVYTNYLDQPFEVNILKYFVSNFQFVSGDGTTYTVPQDESYFLIDQKKSGSNICEFEVPNGIYTKVRFMLGVDSLRNTMPLDNRKGALDPTGDAAGMYWDWNSGYIHLMFEGKSEVADVTISPSKKLIYHVGGYGGMTTSTYNNTRWIEVDLQSNKLAPVHGESGSGILLNVDIPNLFYGEHTIDFAITPVTMTDRDADVLADNFQSMFSHTATIVE